MRHAPFDDKRQSQSATSQCLLEHSHWRGNGFGRSAPVLGRSDVVMPKALEIQGAMARLDIAVAEDGHTPGTDFSNRLSENFMACATRFFHIQQT